MFFFVWFVYFVVILFAFIRGQTLFLLPCLRDSVVNPVSQPLRIVMMGTGPFAVPTFRALLATPERYRVLSLVTRPDRVSPERLGSSRSKSAAPVNPMRDVAIEHDLPVFEPDSINSPAAQEFLQQQAVDLYVVCDYGQILSRETLSLSRLGGINLHGSLLPKYRGAAPINWAIYHGERETGITVIHMTPTLDGGPCLVQVSLPIEPHETAPVIEAKLSELGPHAVEQAIEMLAAMLSNSSSSVQATQSVSQDPAQVTKAPRLKKTDGLIDWSRTAEQIVNQIRAFQPWPKSHTFWTPSGKEPLRLIIEAAAPASTSNLLNVGADSHPRPLPADQGDEDACVLRSSNSAEDGVSPGTVLVSTKQLIVSCGDGAIELLQIQPAGKRVMTAEEFLRGYSVQIGDRLG